MSTVKRWALLFTVTAGLVGGAALALASRRHMRKAARELEHTSDLASWEDEGGSVPPAATDQAQRSTPVAPV